MRPKQRIEALRRLMREHGLSAYYVPSTDAHMSEYLPTCWERRAWISGFTGSAGDVLVTRDKAGLWADGRYYLQASNELRGSGIKLFKMGQPKVPTLDEYIAAHLGEGQAVGVDPRVVSMRRMQRLQDAAQKAGGRVVTIDTNLIDEIWDDQPPVPAEPIRVLPTKYSGETTASKLRRLRKEMAARKTDAHVLTMLDGIAWLYNIRGSDVDFNPVTIAYALVTKDDAYLFVDESKVTARVRRSLEPKVKIRPYDGIARALHELAEKKATVWVEGTSVNQWVVDLLEGACLHDDRSPVTLMKSMKNPVEVEGMRQAHIRDGVAVTRFLCWLEPAVKAGGQTEISVAKKLEEFRREGDLFQGLSFRTISAYRAHAALPHYSVTPSSDVPLSADGIYLVDSGAQYLDGTTDITRTVLLGKKPSAEQKDRFTRVLKGHIALGRARFPYGTVGFSLDTLARMPLWEAELDYNHGTGHGVGHFLNVHEGPRSIANRPGPHLPLEPGNIFSNEPGYYKDGEYGIRTENLIVVSENGGIGEDGKEYLMFETLTACPYDTRLIQVKMLSEAERKWVNSYHRWVQKSLSPHLDSEEKAWLRKACAAI